MNKRKQIDEITEYTKENETKFLKIIHQDKLTNSTHITDNTSSNSNTSTENCQILNDLTRKSFEQLNNHQQIVYSDQVYEILNSYAQKVISRIHRKNLKTLNSVEKKVIEEIIKGNVENYPEDNAKRDFERRRQYYSLNNISFIPLYTKNKNNVSNGKNKNVKEYRRYKIHPHNITKRKEYTPNDTIQSYTPNDKIELSNTTIIINDAIPNELFELEIRKYHLFIDSIIIFQGIKVDLTLDPYLYQVLKYRSYKNENNYSGPCFFTGKVKRNCIDMFIISTKKKNSGQHTIILFPIVTKLDQNYLLAEYIMWIRKRATLTKMLTLPRRMLISFAQEYLVEVDKEKREKEIIQKSNLYPNLCAFN